MNDNFMTFVLILVLFMGGGLLRNCAGIPVQIKDADDDYHGFASLTDNPYEGEDLTVPYDPTYMYHMPHPRIASTLKWSEDYQVVSVYLVDLTEFRVFLEGDDEMLWNYFMETD